MGQLLDGGEGGGQKEGGTAHGEEEGGGCSTVGGAATHDEERVWLLCFHPIVQWVALKKIKLLEACVSTGGMRVNHDFLLL
jgi:hypothetical protein